ncbi:hypothetical protein [Amycolatopsis australiensis]|uniref:hypothetical protein n=1 Tax=Amycolatopsis australiensis TaxID=546364 RepID=UPI0009304C20|nr:hypothetical protein [Amycolatopsis australiensis]
MAVRGFAASALVALAERGFAVYGQDHHGHGASITGEPGDLGPGGWPTLVADIGVLTARAPLSAGWP